MSAAAASGAGVVVVVIVEAGVGGGTGDVGRRCVLGLSDGMLDEPGSGYFVEVFLTMMHFESETRIYAAVFRSHHCYFPLRTIVTHVDVPYYAQTNGFKTIIHGLLHVKRQRYDRVGKMLPFRLPDS